MMRLRTCLPLLAFLRALAVLNTPAANAQYVPWYPLVDPWYGDYDEEDYYEHAGDRAPAWSNPESGVQRALEAPYSEWEYESWEGEWELQSLHGELDYEPQGALEPASREAREQAIRDELEKGGAWEDEPLGGEWEYQSEGAEIEYEPAPWY